jgi:polysaccharide export outer membrane protein
LKLLIRIGVLIFCLGLNILPAWGADEPADKNAAAGPLPAVVSEAPYVIGPGDVLDISVWKDTALTKVVPVLPDGTISFPLVDEMKASGKTVAELRRDMEAKIAGYIADPMISVSIQQVNSMQIYILGRVNHPGRFVLNRSINVLQALAVAGGVNAFAEKDDIRIFRETEGGHQVLAFDYDDVTRGRHIEQNVRLLRGDIIFVP